MNARGIRRCVGKDDPIIVEVGANCGQTTLDMLEAMPRATIYAFEPDPRVIAHGGVRFLSASRYFYTEYSNDESCEGRISFLPGLLEILRISNLLCALR